MGAINKKDIIDGLKRIGVKPGMELEVHSSLKSFGFAQGGAETVIDALKFTLGVDGSIFMPALRLSRDLPLSEEDKKNGVLRKIKVLPPEEWFVENGAPPVQPWYTIQNMAYEMGFIKEGTIGDCKCMFFDIAKVINIYKEELIRDPYKLYGIVR